MDNAENKDPVQEGTASEQQASQDTGASSSPAVEQSGTQDASTSAPAAAPIEPPAPPVTPPAPPAPAPAPVAPPVAAPAKSGVGTVVETKSAAPAPVSSGKPAVKPLEIPGVDKSLASVPAAFQSPLAGLEAYLTEMAPGKPITIERGAQLSVVLLRTITNLINRQEEHFNAMFGALLKIIDAHNDGVFHEAYVYRFVPHMNASSDELKAFTNLIHMLKTVAAPAGRKEAAGQVDFERALRYALTDAGRNRVMGFFGK